MNALILKHQLCGLGACVARAHPGIFSGLLRSSKGHVGCYARLGPQWFTAHTEILDCPHTAYAILVSQCTHPFAGKATNIFTYDIQQTEALDRALASAVQELLKVATDALLTKMDNDVAMPLAA